MNDLQNEILFSGRNAYLINSARRNYDALEAKVRQKDDWFPILKKSKKKSFSPNLSMKKYPLIDYSINN